MSKRTILAALLVGVALHPAPLRAQSAPAAASAPAVQTTFPPQITTAVELGVAPLARLAPRSADAATAGPLAPRTSLEPMVAPVLAARRHSRPGVVLMIVGGAGILLGSIIEEDLVTVAGAGVGLYGLYLYLR